MESKLLGYTHEDLFKRGEDLVQSGKKVVQKGRKTVADVQRNVEAFKDLSSPPPILVEAIREFAARNSGDLRNIGVRSANEAVDRALAAIRPKKRVPVAPPAKPNPWLRDVVQPIAGPVVEGFGRQLRARAMPYIKVAAAIVVGTLAGTFFLGRWSARKA